MQQFVVPQFIDVENKILGPITTRQFVLLIVWAIIEFVIYKSFDTIVMGVFSFLIFAVFFPITFLKFNGKPIHYLIINGAANIKKPKLRIWSNLHQAEKIPITKSARELRDEKRKSEEVQFAQKTSKPSRLSELSLIVDTGGVYEGEESPEDIAKELENISKKPLNKST